MENTEVLLVAANCEITSKKRAASMKDTNLARACEYDIGSGPSILVYTRYNVQANKNRVVEC